MFDYSIFNERPDLLNLNKIKYFFKITSADQLLSFLEMKHHDFYHHFTTIEALNAILRTKKWLMSPAQRMNDQHECTEKGNSRRWKQLVFTCFSFGDEDNMAMWAMYGLPWKQGIRITIPDDAMQQWICELRNTKWRGKEKVKYISLHDIVYYDGMVDRGDANLLWARGKCKTVKDNGIDIAQAEFFTGYVKNSAWKHESESRLMIVLKEDYVDKICIPIPESVLMRLKICLGPMVEEATEQALSKILKGVKSQNLQKAISQNIRRCFFQDKVHFKSICDYCAHTYKLRNNHA